MFAQLTAAAVRLYQSKGAASVLLGRVSNQTGFAVASKCRTTRTDPKRAFFSTSSWKRPNNNETTLEQLETGETQRVVLSESADRDRTRHGVGCTPHECHGSIMVKDGFGLVDNNSTCKSNESIQKEAYEFLTQLSEETEIYTKGELEARWQSIQDEIDQTGSYTHTYKELEFGCRLAWRNSGRCIMRQVSFSLQLRDCRHVQTAKECFGELVDHLQKAQNNGDSIQPVISVFAQKPSQKSSPVRIWNKQLLGYAAYKTKDGTILGDPANLEFTALCVQFGWKPPKNPSDFDILPLLISDNKDGLDQPHPFILPPEAILEVPIEHPDHEMLSSLNMRWYGIPAISNVGVEIGGIHYQTCPFNGWYAITEIARDLLDKQRYDMAESVAIACDIPRQVRTIWQDAAQLELHRAILHSFTHRRVTVVDHHTASDSFLGFYQEEIKQRGKCPADWTWLVPPAGGSMTGVFHQEMLNFYVSPQYRLQANVWDEEGIQLSPEPIQVDLSRNPLTLRFQKDRSLYDRILIFYGTETGNSLRFATRLATDFREAATNDDGGPAPLNELPGTLKRLPPSKTEGVLVLCITSTFGRGNAPVSADTFLSDIKEIPDGLIPNLDFGLLALGNSAYHETFVQFGKDVCSELERVGCKAAASLQSADELGNQEDDFDRFRKLLLDEKDGVVYKKSDADTEVQSDASDRRQAGVEVGGGKKIKLSFRESRHVVSEPADNDPVKNAWTSAETQDSTYQRLWLNYSNTMGPSTDTFKFDVMKEDMHLPGNNENCSGKCIKPGDHVAIYPCNVDDVTELVSRMIALDSTLDLAELQDYLKHQVDLAKPLDDAQLTRLRGVVRNEEAKEILTFLLEKTSKQIINPSLEGLVNMLPPGSIPVGWALENPAPITPRFYSIANISETDNTITICQSVFSFPSPVDKAGLTTRWLRKLKQGDKVEAVFSPSGFWLPSNPNDPVVLIATGSGVAPFRSFWKSEAPNPMYLFYGCHTPDDFPFRDEIEELGEMGRLKTFVAYSRGGKRQYVSDVMAEQSEEVLSLLHNPRTHMYLCGATKVEDRVNSALVSILSAGSEKFNGLGVLRATERLVIMKQQNRYKTETYGKPNQRARNDPASLLWSEATEKTARIFSGLEAAKILRGPGTDGG